MPRMKSATTPSVHIKIERMGLTVGELAMLKVEAMQGHSLKQQDAQAYQLQAANERTKGQQFVVVLQQLKDRKRNPPAKVSRMDPLSEYDVDKVKDELEMIKARAQNFSDLSAKYQREAEQHMRDVVSIDVRLEKLRGSGLDREAEDITAHG